MALPALHLPKIITLNEDHLDITASQTPVFDPATAFAEELDPVGQSIVPEAFDVQELLFELGVWLCGLKSFLASSGRSFNEATPGGQERIKELRLVHSVLTICSRLNFRLRRIVTQSADVLSETETDELEAFAPVLRDAILICESVSRSGTLTPAEWRACSANISEKLARSSFVQRSIDRAERSDESNLPSKLRVLFKNRPIAHADEGGLFLVLPRFAMILRSLEIVSRMLRNDEPLKPALVIFSRIQELTQELIEHINNRLSRFPNEEAELFGSLDGASYTASLELKKVFNQELTGLVGVRPAPSVFARVETAYSLLNDSFQYILTGFAKIADPAVTAFELFPNFQIKLDKSLILREHLWRILKSVEAAEQDPGKPLVEKLNAELTDFLDTPITFLFYKDQETVERFCEEILATTDKKDLVPILHRFGAYLETLFGQVNMRSVLAEYPFDGIT